MTKHDTKLLPCPFCGGKAELDRHKTNPEFNVAYCPTCDDTPSPEQWNTRVGSAAQEAELVAALEQSNAALREFYGSFSHHKFTDRFSYGDIAKDAIVKNNAAIAKYRAAPKEDKLS